MQRMLWAVLGGFIISLIIGPTMIKLLRRLKVGQQVYAGAPEEHMKKQGTPTMGGLMFAAVSLAVAFVARVGSFDWKSDVPLAIAVFALLNLALGFADDFLKIRRQRNQGGLKEMQKTIPQLIIALAFAAYCYFHPLIGSSIRLPFTVREWDLGYWYIPVMAFVIYCTLNAANFLDGLDGLLGSVGLCDFAVFGVIGLLLAATVGVSDTQNMWLNVAILCAGMAGALMGYLRYNLHPASMMMGDTGSMYVGAVFVGAAMALRLPLWVPVAGVMMVVSLLSTTVQRYYFKATHGKRLFLNSPFHHHLEKKGMSETRIVSMYVLVTILASLLCFLMLPIGL
ncbi:phospho-N-acetylmuramoyl-pentapeptide-transferase [Clostridia bacterium]|nr:phospho-N-acetylmuramoyl-pentapeptide-transferase [Clostridia bacterium]